MQQQATPWDADLTRFHARVDDATQAVDVAQEVAAQHGFWVTFVTRGDVEHAYGRHLTDDEWNTISQSHSWLSHAWSPDDLIDANVRKVASPLRSTPPSPVRAVPDPAAAHLFVHEIAGRFGLASRVWRREDIAAAVGRPVTPSEWEQLLADPEWTNGAWWPTDAIRERLAVLASVDAHWPRR